MHLAKTKKVLEGSSLPSKRSPLCNLHEHFRKTDSPLATCKNIFQGGICLLQPARAFSEVDFFSCNLQEHFPRWIFPLATCKSIFGRPICLLQPARAFSEDLFSSCNLQEHFGGVQIPCATWTYRSKKKRHLNSDTVS